MAELALRVRVFIASPSDVKPERDIAEEEIRGLADEAARSGLLISPDRWERLRPTFAPGQPTLNEELEKADLTIAIFWSRLGKAVEGAETGSMQEVRIAGERVTRGLSDDLIVYFRTSPAPANSSAEQVEAVAAFRRRLHEGHFLATTEYESVDEFRSLIQRHLREWLERWKPVPRICEYALSRSSPSVDARQPLGENRVQRVLNLFDAFERKSVATHLGRLAVTRYQQDGPMAMRRPFSQRETGLPHDNWNEVSAMARENGEAVTDVADILQVYHLSPAPFLKHNRDQYRFSCAEWFYFFCAWGLIAEITEGNVEAVERRPYINPVHQYIKGLTRRRAANVSTNLIAWLLNETGITDGKPIARNFAAYVLGMIGAREAEDALARALKEDDGDDVRLYCLTSLGKLRSRRYLSLVVDFYDAAPSDEFRLDVARAVSRITGVAMFEL